MVPKYYPIPTTGFLRLAQIIGKKNADPPIVPLIPVGRSTWWAGIKAGRFPKPVKLGPRTTAWRAEDIAELIERGAT
jgi:prophage regulatory protein